MEHGCRLGKLLGKSATYPQLCIFKLFTLIYYIKLQKQTIIAVLHCINFLLKEK